MFEHRNAYLHANGEVEGFVGVGSTKDAAKADAIEQIRRKLAAVAQVNPSAPGFDPARVIDRPSILTEAQRKQVQDDWNSGVRY